MNLVPIQEPEKVWPLCEPLIQKVLDRTDPFEDIDDIYKDLLSRDRQLWVVERDGEIQAAILTSIHEYRGKRYGTLTHAGGKNASEWFDIVNPIGEYFKREGCLTFTIIGRKGWLKYLPDWQTDKVILEKKLHG